MALLFASGLPARRFLLAAVLAPYAVSEVSAAVIWRFLFDPDVGPVDGRAARARPADRSNGRSSRRTARHRRAAVDLAAPAVHLHHPLRGAARDPDAALRSGADRRRVSALQTFRHVTLPLLMPAILVAMLFRYIFAFRLFSEVWLMTQGGPARSTEVVAVYLYLEAFRFNAFGAAAATAWLMVLVSLVLGAGYLLGAAPGDDEPCGLSASPSASARRSRSR